MSTNDNQRQWHLDRRTPISIIVALAIQTGAALWWASKLDSRVEFLERQFNEHTILEAHPKALLHISLMEQQLNNMQIQLGRIEQKLDRLHQPASFNPSETSIP